MWRVEAESQNRRLPESPAVGDCHGMNKLFEELDFRETPIGDLVRQRRKFRVVLPDIEHSPRI
jgi:hypothetical protein